MHATMGHAYLGELAALATAMCWTVSALSFESASRRVGSVPVNLIRLVMAFLLLSLFGFTFHGRLLPQDAPPRTWLWLTLSGLAGFTLGDLCLFRAYVVVGARVSMLILSLCPPMTALLCLLILGEKLTVYQWLGMAVTLTGVSFVVLEKKTDARTRATSRLPLAGILLALGGAFGQACGMVLAKVGMGGYDAFASTQIRVLSGLAGFGVLFTAARWWPRVWAATKNGPALWRMGLGACFGPFLGVSLALLSMQLIPAGVTSTISSIVPVLIIPPSMLLFKDRVTRRSILGSLLAVLGVALMFLS